VLSSNKIESLIRRINGLGGVSWREGIDPRNEIKRLVDELSMRRVLYQPYAWEVPAETITSVLQIRQEIVATLKNVAQGSREHRLLRIMAKACLDYLDDREIMNDREAMEEALETLRLLFGACLLVLSDRHGLNVGRELEAILPQGVDVAQLRIGLIGI
jgi:hypothetical protein